MEGTVIDRVGGIIVRAEVTTLAVPAAIIALRPSARQFMVAITTARITDTGGIARATGGIALRMVGVPAARLQQERLSVS